MQESVEFSIADIVFSVTDDAPGASAHMAGASERASCRHPDMTLVVRRSGLPQIGLREDEKVFDAGSTWSLYRPDGRHVFVIKSPATAPLPYRIADFDADFTHGDIYCHRPAPGSFVPHALEPPLDEVLMVCVLGRRGGLLVHACGVDDGGRGYLFAGKSTRGKSTMARLWRDRATVLNDDRVVVREREGRFWIYGTPWHGEFRSFSPGGAPLEKIFFLRHAEENEVRAVGPSQASAMLLACAFPPLWDADSMRRTLDVCAGLTASVPCRELGFVPDQNVVELVRCAE